MKRAKKRFIDGVEILDRLHYDGHPERIAGLQNARFTGDLARRVYALREASGLTQRELAKLVGTTPSVISRLEDDDYEGHSLWMLQRIAKALGMCVELHFVPIPKDPRSRPKRRVRSEPYPRKKKRVG